MASKEERLEKLRREEEELEAAHYGTELLNAAEQDEQVLDGKDVVTPEESDDLFTDATADVYDDPTTPEDTTVKPTGELAKLRKEHSDLKHRWNRYKGSTDRTLFDLRTEVSNLSKSLAKLREENSNLKTQLAESSNTAPDVFTQDVIDVLGEEAVDAIKASTTSTAKQLAEIRKQMEAQETDRLTKQSESAKAENHRAFLERLEELVPDLHEMNEDPDFNAWLRQPGSDGIERLQILREDQNRFDSRRVSEFFIEYKRTHKNQNGKREVTDSVESHSGPTGKRTAESNTYKDPAKKGWVKQSQINQFNRDVAKGKYKYDSVRAEAFEELVFKAMNEGKIHYDEQPI